MDAFLLYLLKSAVFFTVLYICIRTFLSNETFFRFNRWVLLAGVALCLVLPFVRVTISENIAAHIPSMMLEKALTSDTQAETPTLYTDSYIDDVAFPHEVVVMDTDSPTVNIGQILLLIYIVGLIVNFVILTKSIYLMARVIRAGTRCSYKGYKLILSSEDVTPFSWGNYIVLSESDYKNHPEEILTHEVAHIRLNHSVDLIFIELILLLQWFNPAVWLLKRELKDIHEYQADISVLQSGIDATKYQLLLVKKAVGASSYTLANSFNHSKIKKRITMMLKEKSNKWARLKLLLLLPLGTLTVFAFAHPETEDVMDSFRVDEVTKNISDGTSIRDTNDGIINTYVDGKLVATHSLNRNVIGKESFGKFNIIHTTDARDNITTIFPYEFASKENPGKTDFLKIKEYVSAGKQYTTNDFLNKYKGCILFLERSKVEDGYNQVSEVYGVLADGSKTPAFYMTMMDTKAASDSVPPKTIKFTPPHTKKSSGKSSSKTPPPPPPIKKNSQKIVKDEWPDLSSYKVGDTFTDAKGRKWEVTSIDPPEMKLKSSSSQATVKISKKGYKYVGSIVRDTVPPPPPPIKADQTKKEEDGK